MWWSRLSVQKNLDRFDLITYPSLYKGLGNAFLEAVYFRKPIVVNTYSIYAKDIKPKGFSVIEIDGFVTEATVEKTRQVMHWARNTFPTRC